MRYGSLKLNPSEMDSCQLLNEEDMFGRSVLFMMTAKMDQISNIYLEMELVEEKWSW